MSLTNKERKKFMSNLCDNCENPSWTGEDPIPAPPYPGGGEAGDFNDLSNRPKYNGTEITSETNIPKVVNTPFDGATSTSDGTAGLVPTPESGEEDTYLKGDGSWGVVDYAESTSNIVTDTQQDTTGSFMYRTSGGTASIATGKAELVSVKGNTIQETTTTVDYEVVSNNLTRNPTVTIAENIWLTLPWGANDGTYIFTTQAGGSVVVTDEDGNVVGTPSLWATPLTGIVMVPTQAATQQAVGSNVTIRFSKVQTTALKTANPIEFQSVGFNQVPGGNGGKVIAGNLYRIDADYTSITVTPFDGSATYSIVPDENEQFTPTKSGWITIDGSGQVLVALVWSGGKDEEPYEPMNTFNVDIPLEDKNGNALPTASYGMPSVNNVADEINYRNKVYIQRIGRYDYSEANLEAVQALGVDYIYDNSVIFYVLPTPVVYELNLVSTSGVYDVNDYGTEWFVKDALGTPVDVPLTARIIYGNNLVDKLKNLADIQSVGDGLSLDNGTLNVSGESGGSVTKLTSADYNYPESGTKTSVALWKLPTGLYYADNAASLNTVLKVYDNDTSEYYYYSTFLVFEDAQSQGYVTIYGLMGSDGNIGHIWKVWKQNGYLSDSLSIPTAEYVDSTFQYAPDVLYVDDYDYPEEDPDGIAVWDLNTNTNYTFYEPVKVYLNSTTSFTCSTNGRLSIGNTSGSNKFFEFVICENGTTDVMAGFGFTNYSTGAKVTLKSYTTSDIAANVSNNDTPAPTPTYPYTDGTRTYYLYNGVEVYANETDASQSLYYSSDNSLAIQGGEWGDNGDGTVSYIGGGGGGETPEEPAEPDDPVAPEEPTEEPAEG